MSRRCGAVQMMMVGGDFVCDQPRDHRDADGNLDDHCDSRHPYSWARDSHMSDDLDTVAAPTHLPTCAKWIAKACGHHAHYVLAPDVPCSCGALGPTCWLGPFSVVREPRGRKHYGLRWMIIARSGHPVQVGIPYKVDAQTACDRLNLGAKVVGR